MSETFHLSPLSASVSHRAISLVPPILNTSLLCFSQNGQPQKNQPLGDPPQIYLTSVSDPSSLTSLIQVAGSDCVVSSQQGHPVFVVIKPQPVGEAKEHPSIAPAAHEDLLDIVDLDVKPEAEVRISLKNTLCLQCKWYSQIINVPWLFRPRQSLCPLQWLRKLRCLSMLLHLPALSLWFSRW